MLPVTPSSHSRSLDHRPRPDHISPNPDRFVVPLARLDPAALGQAGGKATSLAAMLRAGLPVPPGFVVTTSAYRRFITHHDLDQSITTLPQDRLPEAEAADLRARIIPAEMPHDLADTILAAWREMGRGQVVVRSSATAEDLPGASFAGQHDSFLNLADASALLDAVRRCWASLWNPRAIAYRRQQGLDAPNVALAVVVQRLVDAERAGVLFTANPLDHRRDRMLLSASFGLGEAVVSGAVTPDQWLLDAEGRILETRIADKRVITRREGAGTAEHPMPEAQRHATTLSDAEVAALAELGRRAQAHFGAPQDIEWTIASGVVQVVQSRPITALFPLPEPLPPSGTGLRLYLCFNMLAQQMPEPFTPMGIAYWRALVGGFERAATGRRRADLSWLKMAAGRLFADITPLLRKPGRWAKLAESVADKDPVSAAALLAFRDREGAAIIGSGRGLGFLPRLVPLGAWLGWRALLAALAPERARRRVLRETDAAIRELEREAATLTAIRDRVDFLHEALGARGAFIWILPVAVMAPGLMAESAARTRLRRWLGPEADADFNAVLRALPHNVTTKMGMALAALAERLRAEGAAPDPSHPAVAAFLECYGHRAVWEIDAGVARWREDPGTVLDLLRARLDGPAPANDAARFQALATEAEAAAMRLVRLVRARRGAVRAVVLGWLLRRIRALLGLREQPKFEGARMIALARRVMLDAGALLVARGALDRAEDVVFLGLDDLLRAEAGEASDLRAQAAAAREAYQREKARRAVPRWMASTGECLFGAPADDAQPGVLRGHPVSAGTHEGVVRVVTHPSGAELRPGEVLVCRGTDPAWTPLFLTAGALVMETGGAVSHRSIVAREYGLPAVAGVMEATTRLADGQHVRVDGTTGVVVVLATDAPAGEETMDSSSGRGSGAIRQRSRHP